MIAISHPAQTFVGNVGSYLSGSHRFSRDEELGVDVVEVPLEGLAPKAVPQLSPGADVAEIPQVVADALVVILFEVVQPDLSEPDGVPPEDVDAAPPLVWGPLPEDVADVAAGHDLQRAAAHPRLEGQLEVLAAPDVEAGVVSAESLEELAVYGEETSGHGGTGDRLGGAVVLLPLAIGNAVPVELQIKR